MTPEDVILIVQDRTVLFCGEPLNKDFKKFYNNLKTIKR